MKLWPNVILGTRDESLRTSSGEANVHTTRDEFSWLKNLTRLFVHKEPLNSFALFNFNFFIGFSLFQYRTPSQANPNIWRLECL